MIFIALNNFVMFGQDDSISIEPNIHLATEKNKWYFQSTTMTMIE